MGLPRSHAPRFDSDQKPDAEEILQDLFWHFAVVEICKGWETFSQIPTHGTVFISYKCAPEDRNFKAGSPVLI